MPEKFEDHLSKVKGAIRRVNINNDFVRKRDISTYYWNNASDLNSAALVIWNACYGKDSTLTPQMLGLGKGFSFSASLPPVFAFLAGLSLELSLKAIAKILGRPFKATHQLNDLCNSVGISVTVDQQALLDMFTEHIYWRSRYPVPRREGEWLRSLEVFRKALKRPKAGSLFSAVNENCVINLENYLVLWSKFADAYWQAKSVILEP